MQSLFAPIAIDMPLRKDQQDFIREEIGCQLHDAIDSFRPRGWRKALSLAREFGTVATIISVFVGLLALTAGAFYQAFARIAKDTQFQTRTDDRLTAIETSVAKISATLDGLKLKQIANAPLTPKDIAEAKDVLISAAASKSEINPAIVNEAGVKFVEAAQSDPPAWNTAIAFLNYKSFLNGLTPRFPVGSGKKAITTSYHAENPPKGYSLPRFQVPSDVVVPSAQAARLNLIGVDANAGLSVGNPYLTGLGGGIVIDGMELRNIIFSGVHIVYKGGPLKMENVYFENCSFDITPEQNGQSFAQSFLKAESSTSFTAS